MSPTKDRAFLRQLLTSGADLLTLAPLASEALKRLVPSFSLSLIRVDERCAPTEHYSEYFDEFSHALFANAGHAFSANTDDPAAFGNLLRGPKRFGTLIDTPPAYLAGATYTHLFQRNGIHHCLDIAIRERARPLGILGIFREECAPAFTTADLVHVAELYPYLVHALSAPALPATFDEAETALLVCDPQGKVLWATPVAKAWLGSAVFRDERLALVGQGLLPETCRALVQRLAKLQAANSAEARTLAVPALELPVPGGRLRLRAYGLAGLDASRENLVGIQLSLEMHRGLRLLALLEQSRLSPQQKKIAYMLASRRSPQEIAQAMELRPATLKSYQKELYARMDVGGVEELVRTLDEGARSVTFDLERHLPRA